MNIDIFISIFVYASLVDCVSEAGRKKWAFICDMTHSCVTRPTLLVLCVETCSYLTWFIYLFTHPSFDHIGEAGRKNWALRYAYIHMRQTQSPSLSLSLSLYHSLSLSLSFSRSLTLFLTRSFALSLCASPGFTLVDVSRIILLWRDVH